MVYLKNTVTALLHKECIQLTKLHNLLSNGLYPGRANSDLNDCIKWVEDRHEAYKNEFMSRSDARDYEPGLFDGPQPGVQGDGYISR